jgi:hypothetical protein
MGTTAKRGDLIVVEITERNFYIGQESTTRQRFEVGRVTNITRDGTVKKWARVGLSETPCELSRTVGLVRWYIADQQTTDVEKALDIARAHHYDGHPNHARPFDSFEEVREALKPARR